MLQSLVDLEGASVADLFAGSGALGIEALSRGATRAAFVDQAAGSVACVTDNLAATGLGDDADVHVVRDDVLRWLARRGHGAGDGANDAGTSDGAPFDVVFCDPPYAFDAWRRLLDLLVAHLVVIESADQPDVGDRWEVIRSRRYGGTLVTVVRPTSSPEKGLL